MEIIKTIKLENTIDCSVIGGKARGLLMLSKAGYLIPNTYLIVIGDLMNYWKSDDQFETSALNSIVNAVKNCIDACNTQSIILRSSCEIEDGMLHSFAGIFNSIVFDCKHNVDKTLLAEEIHRMISVPLGNKYQQYCKQNNIVDYPNYFTILVQPYIRSSLSGVLFTTNPISLNGTEVVIEFVNGNNECITSGTVVPATIAIDTSLNMITQFDLGETNIALTIQLKSLFLSLARSGKRLEKIAGVPQDIEWLYCDDCFTYLQARPITTFQNPSSI